jgi:hypothetical protein
VTTDSKFTINRPVYGDVIIRDVSTTPQLSGPEFLAQIDALLDLPGVTGLVWNQYTPYFNDGDPCEFGVNEVRVLVGETESSVDHEYGDASLSTYDLYTKSGAYVGEWPDRHMDLDGTTWVELPNGASARDIYVALTDLKTSAWEDVCRTNFGDHAEVTATRRGFSVEFYEHD